jgi:hypothetical protein
MSDVDLLQLGNVFRSMIHLLHLLLGDFQIITSASENEINQVAHGYCRVALVLTQPLGGGRLCVVALSENVGCLHPLDDFSLAR